MEITLPASNSLSPPDTCDRGPNKKREIKGQKIAWATKRSARGKPNAAAERRRRASLVLLRMLAMGSSHSCQKHRHGSSASQTLGMTVEFKSLYLLQLFNWGQRLVCWLDQVELDASGGATAAEPRVLPGTDNEKAT